MKKLVLCTLLMFSPIVAMAQNSTHTPDAVSNSEIKNEAEWKYYISANVGAIVSEVEIKDDEFLDFGMVTNLEFGAKYNHWRVALAWQNRAEVSELFQTLFGHTVSIGNSALRMNGYYDFISGEHFTMYIGAGLGGNWYDYTINEQYNNYKKSRDGLSFIAGANAGMIFSFWHLGIDIGFAVDYISYPEIVSYGPTFGLRYNF